MKDYDLTEESWRVDKETAKLAKEAGFNEPTRCYYNKKGDKEYSIVPNTNEMLDAWCCAPLIPVLMLQCERWGYKWSVLYKGHLYYEKSPMNEFVAVVDMNNSTQREQDLAFIQACLKHRIELNKQNQ